MKCFELCSESYSQIFAFYSALLQASKLRLGQSVILAGYTELLVYILRYIITILVIVTRYIAQYEWGAWGYNSANQQREAYYALTYARDRSKKNEWYTRIWHTTDIFAAFHGHIMTDEHSRRICRTMSPFTDLYDLIWKLISMSIETLPNISAQAAKVEWKPSKEKCV